MKAKRVVINTKVLISSALAGRADWLVSGDRDLLGLPVTAGLRILSPADALALVLTPPTDTP